MAANSTLSDCQLRYIEKALPVTITAQINVSRLLASASEECRARWSSDAAMLADSETRGAYTNNLELASDTITADVSFAK